MQNVLSLSSLPLAGRGGRARGGWLRWPVAVALAVFALVGGSLAAAVQAGVSKNNVTYSAQGLPANAQVTVQIKNLTTGSATSQGPFNTGEYGRIPPSTGGTGDSIAPGTTVEVTVVGADGNNLGQSSTTKAKETDEDSGLLGTLVGVLRRILRV